MKTIQASREVPLPNIKDQYPKSSWSKLLIEFEKLTLSTDKLEMPLIWKIQAVSDWQIKNRSGMFIFAWLFIYSYIWRHLDIGYVQGMCDLLAPLLVILDDGESHTDSLLLWHSVYFYMYWWKHSFTFSPQHPPLLPPIRGHGLQLFYGAHEENESKLSTRRSYGYSFCQHALTNPGDSIIQYIRYLHAPVFFTFFSHSLVLSLPESPRWCLFRSWILSCLSSCIRTETTPTSTSATAGSS